MQFLKRLLLILVAIVLTPLWFSPFRKDIRNLWNVIGKGSAGGTASNGNTLGTVLRYALALTLVGLLGAGGYKGVEKVIELHEGDLLAEDLYRAAGHTQSWLREGHEIKDLADRAQPVHAKFVPHIEVGPYDAEHFYVQLKAVPWTYCDEFVAAIEDNAQRILYRNTKGDWVTLPEACPEIPELALRVTMK